MQPSNEVRAPAAREPAEVVPDVPIEQKHYNSISLTTAPERPTPSPRAAELASEGRSGKSGAGGGGTGPGPRTIFDKKGTGKNVVYVIDYSGSMQGARLEAAKKELITSIRKLRTDMRFYVIFYDSSMNPMPAETLLPASSQNVAKMVKWIEEQTGGGGTDPSESLTRALDLKPDTVWLLSDGQFDPRVAELVKSSNPGPKVSVNTIAFHDPAGEAALKQIASENRGDFRFIPAPPGTPAGPVLLPGLPLTGRATPPPRGAPASPPSRRPPRRR